MNDEYREIRFYFFIQYSILYIPLSKYRTFYILEAYIICILPMNLTNTHEYMTSRALSHHFAVPHIRVKSNEDIFRNLFKRYTCRVFLYAKLRKIPIKELGNISSETV